MGTKGPAQEAMDAAADKSQVSGDAIQMPVKQDREARPEDQAPKGLVSAKLNEDAAKYRKGPSF